MLDRWSRRARSSPHAMQPLRLAAGEGLWAVTVISESCFSMPVIRRVIIAGNPAGFVAGNPAGSKRRDAAGSFAGDPAFVCMARLRRLFAPRAAENFGIAGRLGELPASSFWKGLGFAVPEKFLFKAQGSGAPSVTL